MRGNEVKRFVITMSEHFTRSNKVTLRIGINTELTKRYQVRVLAFIIEQFWRHSIRRNIVLVHQMELDPTLFSHVADSFTSFQIENGDYEKAMEQIWQLQDIIKRNVEVPVILFHGIEDIFRGLGGKISLMESLIAEIMKIQTPIIFIHFRPPFTISTEIPYQSLFDNFGIRYYLLSRKVL